MTFKYHQILFIQLCRLDQVQQVGGLSLSQVLSQNHQYGSDDNGNNDDDGNDDDCNKS